MIKKSKDKMIRKAESKAKAVSGSSDYADCPACAALVAVKTIKRCLRCRTQWCSQCQMDYRRCPTCGASDRVE